MQTQQAIASHIQRTSQQDSERGAFLLESFAVELVRRESSRKRVPLTFASYSPEDGFVLVAGTASGTAILRN